MAISKIEAASIGYAGAVLQVVNATYSTDATTSGFTLVDTGLTATITPKFVTSKILVIVSTGDIGKSGANCYGKIVLLRNSTIILNFSNQFGFNGSTAAITAASSASYLDSPATTSATTYKTQFGLYPSSGAGTIYVQGSTSTATITLMEIAG